MIQYNYISERHPKAIYVLAIDPARMGRDFSAFVVLEKKFTEDRVKVVFIDELSNSSLTETIGRAILLDSKFNFEKIYIDETGLGAGVTDVLKERLGANKIEGVTFTVNSKQDMFHNLELLMQQKRLAIPNHKKLIFELLSIKYKISETGNYKIYHDPKAHDDLACALALASLHFRAGKKAGGNYIIC